MNQTETNEDLLSRARTGDRDAVDALIREYARLVYGAALRQSRGDAAMAADVAQAVFMVFARRVATIRSARALPAWLHQTTRYAAREAHRAADRRAHHERRAARAEQTIMDPLTVDHADPKLAMLDDAIASLRKSDRDVVVRRYLDGRDVRAIATELGVGEEAARKRLSRAVDKLRAFYARRGVVMGTDAVTAVLLTAGTVAVPAAVLQGCISAAAATMTGGIAVGGAGAVAKGVLYTIGATKLKVAAVAAVAAVAGTVVAVGAIAGASAMLQPRGQQVALPPDHAQAATTNKAQAMAELSGAYTLADSQMMRVIRPPFPAARAAWVDAEFPSAQGSQNILSLGFRTTPAAGRLDWRYMSYEPLELENLVRDVPWFRIEGLERVSFPPIAADVVVRGGITDQQHLEAVADVVEQFTGARFLIVHGQTTRPCVILKGPTRRPAESRPGFATVILTQSPLNPAATKRWLGGDLVEGTRSESRLAYASKLLDAPVFLDGSDSSTSAELNDVGLYLVAPDAQLEWRDPLYEARLKRILANLPRQVGGDWRIEHRTLDVLRFEPAAGP